MNQDTPINEINHLLEKSWEAFHQYRKYPLSMRAKLLRTIAEELELSGDQLIQVAMRETNLPEARLRNERGRTIFQLNSYGEAAEKGHWLEARIDTADPNRNPPKPDIRKMLVPIGPVVVFGASNFPFAFSTAGGDTASALAAGCPVIVKAHPAHPETSGMAAEAIKRAVSRCGLHENTFTHVYGTSIEVGRALVTHPRTKAVGFTGSFQGGKALFDWANQRKEPIPVFAEMGSVNPVFLFPDKIRSSAADIASMYAGSITLGVGQFCTNPGLLIGVEGDDLNLFITELGKAIRKTQPAPMLHSGIARTYQEKKAAALAQAGNVLVAESEVTAAEGQGSAAVASVSGDTFLENPLLHQEVFGPYSLVVRCRDIAQVEKVTDHLEGQLTATLMATETDIRNNETLVEKIKNICGRLLVNGVPTGVEVCLAMHHGGPYPATTDARFTSVGADSIKRFARPLSFQNWPDELLPDELKNGNPLGISRTVNNVPGLDKI